MCGGAAARAAGLVPARIGGVRNGAGKGETVVIGLVGHGPAPWSKGVEPNHLCHVGGCRTAFCSGNVLGVPARNGERAACVKLQDFKLENVQCKVVLAHSRGGSDDKKAYSSEFPRLPESSLSFR